MSVATLVNITSTSTANASGEATRMGFDDAQDGGDAAMSAGTTAAGAAVAVTPSASTPPILDDTDRASRLKPAPAFAEDAATLEPEPEPEPEPEAEPLKTWTVVGLHSRYVSVPQAFFALVFDTYTSYRNVSTGLSVDYGQPNKAFWTFEFNWAPIIPEAGNWKTSGEDNVSATYVFSKQHMLSADVTYRRSFDLFSSDFHWLLGAGAGVGVLLGDFETAEVLPTCQAPVGACAHWRAGSNKVIDMPTRVIPIIHITTGLQYDFGDSGMLRLEAGFRNMLYVGLAGGITL